MTPWLQDADVTLYHGDVLATLREIPDESVDCVVTSPPYWGLRDYGTPGQLGLEPTPEQYVERMVEVFREVRRVLASHGTCWVNLGDSYAGAGYSNHENTGGALRDDGGKQRHTLGSGLKPKDLVGIPWRVAFALQADGWYLRSDIIWSKPNPMPESVTDRPTKSHEYLYLLSKNPRYYFDAEAVREPHKHDGRHVTTVQGQNGSIQHRDGERWPNGGRNIRSVWEIATQPYPEAHFATFPEELARRCIAAGCPEQVCRVCGKARERVVDVSYEKSPVHGKGSVVGRHYETGANNFDGAGMPRLNKVTETTGFTECECLLSEGEGDETRPSAGAQRSYSPSESKYRSGIVLDPFMGSGTVAYVARKLGRHSIGIDLNAEYLALAARRLQQQSLFAEVV